MSTLPIGSTPPYFPTRPRAEAPERRSTGPRPGWWRYQVSRFEGAPVRQQRPAANFSPAVASPAAAAQAMGIALVIQSLFATLRAMFSSGGGLAPTPLAKGEVPGQIAEVNTPQNKTIARRSQFNNVVNEAIDEVRLRGEGIDPADPDRITDFDTYHQAVVMELRRRGLNAAYDGEELSVGRPGEDFNEQFDISTWQGRVRRFYAAYVSPPVWA